MNFINFDKPAPGIVPIHDDDHLLASRDTTRLLRNQARCRLCMASVFAASVNVGETTWVHIGSRYADSHPHEPVVTDSCVICWGLPEMTGDLDGPTSDLLFWLKTRPDSDFAEPLPVCGPCMIGFPMSPRERVEVAFGNVQMARGALGMSVADPFAPRGNLVALSIRESIDDIVKSIATGAYALDYRGPSNLWSRSGVTISDLAKHRKWMVSAWKFLGHDLAGDELRCPPHVNASGYASVERVMKLNREQTAAAEPVIVAQQRCADIYDIARSLSSTAFTADDVERVLDGGRVGVAILEWPFYMSDIVTTCVAVQWALVPGGVWFNAYGHSRLLGLELGSFPDHALVPVFTGGFAPFDGVADDHQFTNDATIGHAIHRVILALFRVAALPAQGTDSRSVEIAKPVGKHRSRSGRTRPFPYRVLEVRHRDEPNEYPEAVGPRSDPARDGYKIDYTYDVPATMVWRWKGKRGQRYLEKVPRRGYTAGPQDGRRVGREKIRRLKD